MRRIFFSALILTGSITAHAQAKQGKVNIEKLCGCFDVEFKYAETFAPEKGYKYHDREQMMATELALPIETSDKRVVIQHLLVMGDSMVIKHWREDWDFESPFVWQFVGDKQWVKKDLKPAEVKNKWTQTVWEVDDGPRYQGASDWITTDNKVFWQNTTDAPLPRREYTVRNDYNILRRGNRIVLNENGWTHEQDNDKVRTGDGVEKLVAQEKGYNIYTKTDDRKCAYAKIWWEQHSAFWKGVRAEWQKLFNERRQISLITRVDNKLLFQKLDDLELQYNKKEFLADAAPAKIRAVLSSFVDSSPSLSVNN